MRKYSVYISTPDGYIMSIVGSGFVDLNLFIVCVCVSMFYDEVASICNMYEELPSGEELLLNDQNLLTIVEHNGRRIMIPNPESSFLKPTDFSMYRKSMERIHKEYIPMIGNMKDDKHENVWEEIQ